MRCLNDLKSNDPEQSLPITVHRIECGQGKTIGEAVRQADISEQTYYRWRKEYGGMNKDEAKRLKLLEKENVRLKKLVAEQALDIEILKDVNSKNF